MFNLSYESSLAMAALYCKDSQVCPLWMCSRLFCDSGWKPVEPPEVCCVCCSLLDTVMAPQGRTYLHQSLRIGDTLWLRSEACICSLLSVSDATHQAFIICAPFIQIIIVQLISKDHLLKLLKHLSSTDMAKAGNAPCKGHSPSHAHTDIPFTLIHT